MVCRITPEKNEIIAATVPNPQAMSVGSLGTNPVARYSFSTGMNNSADTNVKKAAMTLKNSIGR